MRMQGKRTGNIFSEGQLVLPFRQGESSRFTPQNKFCGYEDSAFQAENTFSVEAFNSPAHFCLKAITFITAGMRPADKDNNRIPA